MQNRRQALAMLIGALAIFGTNGVVVRLSGLPSAVIASVRGIIGAVTLIAWATLRKEKLSFSGIEPPTLARIVLTGALIGGNWVLLYEAFRTTSVAISTVISYIAPAIVVLLSPLVLKERFSAVRLACVIVSFAGLGLITGLDGTVTRHGIALALGAAALYASVVMLNSTFAEVDYRIRTIVEIGMAGLVALPYAVLTGAFAVTEPSARTIIYLVILGTIYTGIPYAMYFSTFKALGAQEISALSYIDPVIAVISSTIVLGEPLTLPSLIGAFLIIGSSVISEMLAGREGS